MARTVGFEGIGAGAYTSFLSALVKGADEDKFVKISANKTVGLCAEGDDFHGIVRVIDQKDKLASVQEHGYVSAPYKAGFAPTLGKCCIVCGDGTNKVKILAAAAGHTVYDVVDVDAVAGTVTFLMP